MPKEKINIGFTNKKYRDGKKFILVKKKNKFNHKIDYKILSKFDFVPKLYKETDKELVWEFIEGEMLKKPTSDDLKKLGKIMRTLHKSKLKFPKNNLKKRMKKYIDIIDDSTKATKEVQANYQDAVNTLNKLEPISPCHNDIWSENIIKDKNGKLWIVDWEYATMGDQHFDIAFFMESFELNEKEKAIFLNEYNVDDECWGCNLEWLEKYQRFVNYLTLCWALSQNPIPFSLDKIKKRLK